jgi:hypothetical protein
MTLQLVKSPSAQTGMLIRRSPHDVFEALADPSITTRFWYTKSSGRMEEGAELTWEWEMYGVSGEVWVREVEPDRCMTGRSCPRLPSMSEADLRGGVQRRMLVLAAVW